MKIKAYSLFIFFAISALARADTIREWSENGCPSPDREWQAKDYTALRELLANGTLPLPRLETEPGRIILKRLINTENLAFHKNRKLPLETRLSDLMNLMDVSGDILMLYARAANAGKKVEKELSDLLVFELAVASASIDLAEEFIPTIPKDEKYEMRMEGVAKMKSGLTTVLNGAVTSLSERAFYSDESVAKIAHGIREYYPRFATILPDTTKTEFRVKVGKMMAKEKNPELKREFASLIEALKVAPVDAANGSQPIRIPSNSASAGAGR